MRQGRTLVFLLILGVLTPTIAVERSLIDFATYNENIAQVVKKDQEIYNQIMEKRPELDIQSFGWPEFYFDPADWNLESWKIKLNPSADTVMNRKDSNLRNAPSVKYGNVLGIRLKFHPWENRFWGSVSKPFYFMPIYADGKYISQDANDKDAGLAVGMLANVGQIKNARSWLYGLNYNYNYGVRVENQDEKIQEFYFGSTFYEGWRRLSWENPYYIDEPNKWEPVKNPLYPFAFPFIKFESLVFYKPDGSKNPHFFGYVKDVTIDYDYSLVREANDIDDEAIWGVLAEYAVNRKIIISKIIAEQLLLRKNLIKLKQAGEAESQQQQQNNNTQEEQVQ